MSKNWLNKQEIKNLGLKSVGDNVLISSKCSLYGCENISIGSNVRIDDFVTISASREIKLGNNVHIGANSYIAGAEEIEICDFCGISQSVRIYSTVDDFYGFGLSNPMVDIEFRNTTSKPVKLSKYSLIGSGAVIFPGVTVGHNSAIGAMSVVNKSIEDNMLAFGNPCKAVIKRSQQGYKNYEEKIKNA